MTVILASVAAIYFNNSGKPTKPSSNPIRIGFSLGTLREERWQKDRDFFIAEAEKQGAYVQVVSANSDAELQNQQIENLISQHVDILVIVPQDASKAAEIIDSAHEKGIKVLAYDRLIKHKNVDFYVSFDNMKVGMLQAEGVLKIKPSGKFAYIGGSPTDNNSSQLKKGSMQVLNPLIQSGKISLTVDSFTPDWRPDDAYATVKQALTANKTIDAIVAANDGTAYGAIRALEEYHLSGKIPVSGQDAELAACQRIVNGTQTMTVYKPISKLAKTAADLAVQIAKGEQPKDSISVNNGIADIPAFLIEPIPVDRTNMDETIIKDGYHSREDVYGTK